MHAGRPVVGRAAATGANGCARPRLAAVRERGGRPCVVLAAPPRLSTGHRADVPGMLDVAGPAMSLSGIYSSLRPPLISRPLPPRSRSPPPPPPSPTACGRPRPLWSAQPVPPRVPPGCIAAAPRGCSWPGAMSIDSDHINFLVYRYLQESGLCWESASQPPPASRSPLCLFISRFQDSSTARSPLGRRAA